LSSEVGVLRLEFVEMFGESLELGCEDVVFVRVIRVARLLLVKLVLEAVDLRETVGSK